MLKNFRILNALSVRKILKKFEKAEEISTEQLGRHLEDINVSNSFTLDAVIAETELFYQSFLNKSRKEAMIALRLPESSVIFINLECVSSQLFYMAGGLLFWYFGASADICCLSCR